ncbi:MAG: hypothetical protein AB1473_08575 [Thermodesulfobacteriota bacterium]
MASAFQEFSKLYEQFLDKFPNHPLAEEIRRAIGRNRFPDEKWLQSYARQMKELLLPLWLKAG